MTPITSTPKPSSTAAGLGQSALSARSVGQSATTSGVPSPIAMTPRTVEHHKNMMQSPPLTLTTTTLEPSIKIDLDNEHLWAQFSQHTTEMIVTKSGRRMFPTLRYKLAGLDPHASYAILLEMAPTDDARYKFQNGGWVVAGRAEPTHSFHNARVYTHPDSPQSGQLWMRQPLSFSRVKLTNNQTEPHSHVLLNSMHKYSPRVFVMRLNDFYPSVPRMVAQAHFESTQFVAVTAYQNDNVIKLKIDHNPFAKGFRETSAGDKRRHALAFGEMESAQQLAASLPMLLAQQQMRNRLLMQQQAEEGHRAAQIIRPHPIMGGMPAMMPWPMGDVCAAPWAKRAAPSEPTSSLLQSPTCSSREGIGGGSNTRSGSSIGSSEAAESTSTNAEPSATKTTPPQGSKPATKIWNPFHTPPAGPSSTSPPHNVDEAKTEEETKASTSVAQQSIFPVAQQWMAAAYVSQMLMRQQQQLLLQQQQQFHPAMFTGMLPFLPPSTAPLLTKQNTLHGEADVKKEENS